MKIKKQIIITIFTAISIIYPSSVLAREDAKNYSRYPDYGYEYNGYDKFENFNKKMFNFNLGLNKYAIKPVHTLWASIMPQYGMDRIKCACKNIEFPIRMTSCLIQRDFKNSGKEVLRFLTNTTIGLGGLYDPADKLFKLSQVNEDMDQALASCKIKSGPYLVLPVISSTTPRGVVGKILDAGLNPSSYIATPIIAMVKAGLMVNKSSETQSMASLLTSNFADPYDIAKKFYGINSYIKTANFDREDIREAKQKDYEIELVQEPTEDEFTANLQTEELTENTNQEDGSLSISDIANAGDKIESVILKSYDKKNSKVLADMVLFDYNPQTPMIDAMRTALFELPGIHDSIWNELSIWNRCFNKRIKTASINVYPDREKYQFRYLLQKDKNAPLAIIFPSIGESSSAHHSTVLAKLFYGEGYSILIQGSHFQWEFVKSLPYGYTPGIPRKDIEQIKLTMSKEIEFIQNKHKCQFPKKTVIGTSFGAVASMFLAEAEHKENTLNINNYIAISPPINLVYAMKQIDKNCECWNQNPHNLKERTAITASKVMQLYNNKEQNLTKLNTLPFTNEEARLITGFIMRQKLSDLVFTIENASKTKKSDIYNTINNLSYQDYAEKYLIPNAGYTSFSDFDFDSSLLSLEDFMKNNDNYKIYESVDDYFVSSSQLKKLKQIAPDNVVLISNGSHLGFLYRKEFLDALKKDISLSTVEEEQISALVNPEPLQ